MLQPAILIDRPAFRRRASTHLGPTLVAPRLALAQAAMPNGAAAVEAVVSAGLDGALRTSSRVCWIVQAARARVRPLSTVSPASGHASPATAGLSLDSHSRANDEAGRNQSPV